MFRAQFSQFFPPKPAFTEADIAPQHGRVFIVTGGASGIGLELTKVLYQKGGRVYIAGRSEDKARQATQEIQTALPPSDSYGSLDFLHLDLADLTSIKGSADAFKANESRLDVLWNNAGGIELQLATNCLGPFLYTHLLLPLLESTAAAGASASAGSVRVIWTSSQMMELSAPQGGILMSELRNPPKDVTRNYVNFKTGNYLLSAELARQQRQKGQQSVVSVALNPGAARTDLFRHHPWMNYAVWPLLYHARMAALTQLYAGLSEDIGFEQSGCYVVPWGRVATLQRKDHVDAVKGEAEGGTGRPRELWEYCKEMTKDYY